MPLSFLTIRGPFRLTLLLASLAAVSTAVSAADAPLQKFLETYCVSCHDAATKKGGFDLEKLSADYKDLAAFDAWVKVHDQIQAGTMPPKKHKERPEKAEAEAVVKGLETALVNADKARRAGDGRATFRRLNRTEYENTLRDLFQIQGVKFKELLPEDGQAFGFNKSAAGLDLSYVQMAKYMETADVAMDAVIAQHVNKPAVLKAHIPAGGVHTLAAHCFYGQTVFLKDFKYDDSIIPIPTARMTGKDPATKKIMQAVAKNPYNGTIGILIPEGIGDFKPRFPFKAVDAGRYKIRMSLWSFLWNKGQIEPNPRNEIAALLAEGKTIGYFDAPSLNPTVTEIEVWLNPMTLPRSELLFNAISLRPAGFLAANSNLTKYTGSGIALDWLEVEGPILDQWPTAGHRRLFGDLPFKPLPETPKQKGKKQTKAYEAAGGNFHMPKRPPENAYVITGHNKPFITNLKNLPQYFEWATVASKAPEADARRLLGDFLPQAFRRPVAEHEINRYVDLFKTSFATGDVFEVAMRTAYQAALCAPDFLFLKESAGDLDQWALASRLSYFLWNSMPDEALFAEARAGKLHDPAVLHAQVERMLKDPKAERFIVDFTDQWLDLVEIDTTMPDRKLYPEYRPLLRDAMLAETRSFFRELLDKDLSAANVVHSDFAMLNQRLAEHYRIPGVSGAAMRRVPLPPDSGRGGVLTQASVLKVTANGTTTSPVKRGAWVQTKIVGKPPEPQPPNVPAIEPDVRGTTTVRELLAKHRDNAGCASCHNKIDPPGFALEGYDVIGGRQTRYRSLGEGDVPDKSETLGRPVQYTWGQKVDSSGQTADGRPFAGIDEFKKLLLEDPRAVARNMVGQLLTYATGTPAGFADRAAVEAALDKTADSRFGMRSLIHAIVESSLFQTK